MRRSSRQKSIPEAYKIFDVSQEKRLRQPPIVSLIMKFTSRMTRPRIATSICSLAQSLVSFMNPRHMLGKRFISPLQSPGGAPSSLLEGRRHPANSVLTSREPQQTLERIDTHIPLVTTSSTNWQHKVSPARPPCWLLTMFVSMGHEGKPPSRFLWLFEFRVMRGTHQCSATFQAFMNHIF